MVASSSLRRAARVLGWSLCGLFALVLLVVLGSLLFLRTPVGERLAAEAAVSALKSAGIEASLEALEGPLPFSLRLHNLRLADAEGVWLDVPSATLRIGALALLRGHVLVEELSFEVGMPRLPNLPPSAPPEPLEDPLDSLRPAFLKPLGADMAGWLRLASVERLHGMFRLGRDVAGLPLELSLDGGGPLTDLAAEVAATLFHPQFRPESNPESEKTPLLHLSGVLHIGNEGAWLQEQSPEHHPDVAAGVECRFFIPTLETQPKTQKAQTESLKAEPGQLEGSLSLLATLTGSRLSVPVLTLDVPGGRVAATNLSLEDLRLGGDLSAALHDPAAVLRLVSALDDGLSGKKAKGSPEEKGTVLPLTSATLAAALSGTLEHPDLSLNLSAGLLPDSSPESRLDVASVWSLNARTLFSDPALTVDGSVSLGGPVAGNVLPAKTAGKPDASPLLRLHAEAGLTDGTLTAKSLSIDSEWFALSGEGMLEKTGTLAAALRLKLPSLHALTAFPPVAAALKTSPFRDLAGAAQATLEVRRDEAASPLAGSLGVKLAGMRWTLAPLQKTLGETASLGLAFSARPETGAFAIKDIALKAGQASVTGSAALTKDATRPETARVEAALSLALTSLAGLDPALSGPLNFAFRASGPLAAPEAELTLTSPSLGVNTATLERLRVRLHTPGTGEKGGKGTLDVSGMLRDGGVKTLRAGAPLRLASDWAFTPERFSLSRTLLDAPGLALSGTLEALPEKRRLDGGFRLAVTDWSALSSLAGVPLHGSAAVVNVSLASGKTQRLAADWSFGALNAGSTLSVRSFKGRLALDDLFGSQPVSLSATLGSGSAGDFRWQRGTAELSGTVRQPQAVLSLQGKTSADIRASFDFAAMKAHVERLTLTDRRKRTLVGVRLNRPLNVAFGKGLSVDNLDMSILPQGTLTALGSLDGRQLALEARLRDVAVNTARLFTDALVPDGLFNASVALSGTPAQPRGTLSLSLTNLAFPESDMPPASVSVEGQLQASDLLLHLKTDGMGTSPATGSLSLPLTFTASGLPEPALNRPFRGSLAWEGQLASLWRFVPLANASLTGRGSLNATLLGTLSAPELSAAFRVEKAAFEEILLGLALSDINADVAIDSVGLSRLSFAAKDGQGGTVALDGNIGSLVAGFPLALHGVIHNLAPLHRNDLSITLSGTADITGPVVAPDIRAAITVDKGQFQIVGSFGTNIPTLPVVYAGQEAPSAAASSGAGPQLGLTVTIPNRFFVRGKGLESEWKGQLHVAGPASNPAVTGSIHSIRGQFGLLGKQFTLSRGDVAFSGAIPPDPLLNVLVTYAASNITAEATVSGPASSPTLTLSSQPALPQDEVVAQVLFGQSASSLGRMEALQLAAELASLSGFGAGGVGVLGEVREKLGFDVLRFGSMQTGQSGQLNRNVGLLQPPGKNTVNAEENAIPSLEVGKYVMDNVYVGLEQGMSGDATGVRVEIELAPNLNLEGISTPERSQVGVNWK